LFRNSSSYVRLDRVRGAKTKQTRNQIRNTQTLAVMKLHQI